MLSSSLPPPSRANRVPLTIAYFGLPLGALLLAADGHQLVLVASCRRQALGVRRAANLFGRRLRLRPDVNDSRLHRHVQSLRPDLLVSWFWTTRLPPELLTGCRHGGIGVHPSLLPRHRGPDPYAWTILCGDTETGVTAHRLADSYDTGDILGVRRLPVDPAWNAWQLARALDRPSLALLRDVVCGIGEKGFPPSYKQEETLATAAPTPDPEAAVLRFARPTREVLRQIRAFAPLPGAVTDLGDVTVTITRARPALTFPAVLWPGEAAIVDGVAVVRTTDGALALLEGAIEDQFLTTAGLARLVARTKDK